MSDAKDLASEGEGVGVREAGDAGSRVLLVGEFGEDEQRVAEALGVEVVTEEQADALRQLAAAPKRRPSPLLAALVGAVAVGGPAPSRRRSFTERHGLDRQWDASEKAQAEKIAKAEAKRRRKAERRRQS